MLGLVFKQLTTQTGEKTMYLNNARTINDVLEFGDQEKAELLEVEAQAKFFVIRKRLEKIMRKQVKMARKAKISH